MEISQQQMTMAMAVESSCLSLIERSRQLQTQSSAEHTVTIARAGRLAAQQIIALQTCLIALAQATPTSQTGPLRLFGLTQQAFGLVSQFNLDRQTLALGVRSAPQLPAAQIALRIERSLDTWESEVIQTMLTLAETL